MKDQKDAAPAAKVEEAPAAAKAETAAAPRRPAFRLRLKPPVIAGLLGALCLGAVGGGAAVALLGKGQRSERPVVTRAEWKALAARIDTAATDMTGLATDLKLLRDQVAQGREAADRARTELGGRIGQAGERAQRQEGETAAKLAGLGDKLEQFDREQAARLTALGERIDRKVAAAHAAAIPAPVAQAPAAKPAQVASAEPALTGSLPDKAKPPTVDGWVLRDVYDGVAMIENRSRRLVEVGPGDTLPGAGRVEAIERRGRTWVVVTSKGLITSQAW
ncbi:hypothetical protein [Methylobacterium oryzihabitans]|uniref:Uncharacterized protein n=1 Tax=Methylobacterium oryzihabitans TaxID=2499852 RepID=A0A437PG27_9HYPH|nr:hypothetical protein [Methylobacterium oryzihabitans]RVU21064.1 hypothetical protein EOE48_02915 [Methylobacterium oryzihabitans]